MTRADLPDVRPLGRRAEGGAALHLVHPVGGTVFCYLPLARRLSSCLSCLAFESPLLSSAPVEDTSLTGIARRYAAQVDAEHVVLAGWSAGGVIAYEMARRMEAEGRPPRLLVIIDAPAPGTGTSGVDIVEDFARDFAAGVGAPEMIAPLCAERDAVRRRHLLDDLLRQHDPEQTDAEIDRRLRTFAAHRDALRAYRPAGPVLCPTLLVVRDDGSVAGWREWLTGPWTHHRFPTDHYGLLRPPVVDRMAALITQRLADTVPGRAEEGAR